MKTFAQHQPLTDAELDGLAEFLQSCKSGKAMNVEQLDGFFAALIAGPETVVPSEYGSWPRLRALGRQGESEGRLPGLPYSLERCRPRPPYLQASQGRVGLFLLSCDSLSRKLVQSVRPRFTTVAAAKWTLAVAANPREAVREPSEGKGWVRVYVISPSLTASRVLCVSYVACPPPPHTMPTS